MNEALELIPTRRSLLSRLKDWNDNESWKVFFDTYWRLIYSAASKAGLRDAEAQDVVQETVVAVMKQMPGFVYDPAKGSFKGWLLKLTKWKILSQLRKRQKHMREEPAGSFDPGDEELLASLADPRTHGLEMSWDEEWEKNLLEAAIERVKRKVSSKQFQVFDLVVAKNWPPAKVAKTLKVNRAMVYLIKHRVGKLLKTQIEYLRTKPM